MSHKETALVATTFGFISLLGLAMFIKFDTPVAAEFTDNYLRPILGEKTVVGLERIYYNTTDKIQQLTYNSGVKAVGLNLTNGVWTNYPLKIFPNQEVVAYTTVYPDRNRSFAKVTLVQFDMSKLRLAAVAGKNQPGGPVGMSGPGVIPQNIIQNGNLVAAFNGGFQYRDGQYGMIVGTTTILPLKQNLGTLIGYKDGSIKIVNYHGQSLGDNIEFIRQNCPILLENGQISLINPVNRALWGRTLTSNIYTWRSGVGVTKGGNLIFAVGNNLSPTTLASALQSGGAENAIQLDINPYWVRFDVFNLQTAGNYQTSTLVRGIYNGSRQFMTGDGKDFFYLYKK